jgi:hypothetical protein
MAIKGALISVFSAVVLFLLVDHARIHEGKMATVHDFHNALHNIVKSHEGLIVAVVLFLIGALTGIYAGGL